MRNNVVEGVTLIGAPLPALGPPPPPSTTVGVQHRGMRQGGPLPLIGMPPPPFAGQCRSWIEP